jgi:hypothetical protein
MNIYDVPFVRREKASIFRRCNSSPATLAPAGLSHSFAWLFLIVVQFLPGNSRSSR